MRYRYLFFLLSIVILSSCKKEVLDDSDLYFFHYHYMVDEYVYDVYQGKPGRAWGNGYYNSGNSFGEVSFESLEYGVSIYGDRDSPKLIKRDKNVTMFDFYYKDRLSLNLLGWRWFVNAPYIKDGERNYFDTSQSFLDNRDYTYRFPQICDFFAEYLIGVGDLRPCQIVSGWMSFTRHVDNPDIILRVEFEAECESKYPRYGEPWAEGKTYKYHIHDGRIDFTTKMTNMIKGGDRLR